MAEICKHTGEMATLALLVVQMLKNILQSSSGDMVAAVADSGMFVPMFASALEQSAS